MEKHRSACSTRQSPPFGVPGDRETAEEKDGLPRIVENQIIIRGAPIIARSLTAAGTAAMAAGIAIRSKPVKTKKFSVVKKSERKWKMKHHHGSDWKRHWRAERSKYVHYRSYFGSPQIDVQERAVRRANQRRQARRGVVLRGAGSVAMVSGQLVPVLAYGYVASRYLSPTREIAQGKMPVDVEKVSSDLAYLQGTQISAVVEGIATARAVYHVTSTIARSVFDD